MEKKLPKVIIFEGGDVCGKTTQLNNIYNKCKVDGKHVYKFKFPDRYVKYDQEIVNLINKIPSLNDNQRNKCLEILKPNENGEVSPYDLFDKLHKTLYKYTDINDLIENWDEVVELISCDIILNGFNKYKWVESEYNKIVKEDPDSIIFIDRFVDSGDIYNTLLPRNYFVLLANCGFIKAEVLNLYSKIRDTFEILFDYSNAMTFSIWSKIESVNKNTNNKFDFSEKVIQFYGNIRMDDTQSMNFETNNFKFVYFERSYKLYNKFKSEINNKEVNREVSQYDTNELLGNIVSSLYNYVFNNKKTLNPGSVAVVPIDIYLEAYEKFNKDKSITSEEFCRNQIMEMVDLWI